MRAELFFHSGIFRGLSTPQVMSNSQGRVWDAALGGTLKPAPTLTALKRGLANGALEL